MSLLALALAAFGTTSQLPGTVPGLSQNEGVFLVTAADDGSRAVYFVANNERHAIAEPDFQTEQQLNPLWPVRVLVREDVAKLPEGAPIGSARAGLIGVAAPVAEAESEAIAAEEVPPST